MASRFSKYSFQLLAALGCTVSTASLAQQEIITVIGAAPVAVDKTGVPAQDIPRSIQVVPRALFEEQGAAKLYETLRNVSGVTQGGQFAFGFYDRFIIRGLNASYLNDGLPDGSSDLGGLVHSLTGVERVEVLKGPGSALYGSSGPGGTINLYHYRPSENFSGVISEQYGSYGTSTTDLSATGPTGIDGLNWRIDGEYQTSDGFRQANSKTGEFLGSLGYRLDNHDIQLRYEYRHLENLPDAAGVFYMPPANIGGPIPGSRDRLYYTPFAYANQNVHRLFLSDAWVVNDTVVVNMRGSFTARQIDLARNAGGTLAASGSTYSLTRRQLRQQTDNLTDIDLQIEPVWHFGTGSITHTLVTGADFRSLNGGTARRTADLPNIADIYTPVRTETGLSSLSFLCDSGHSCDDVRMLGQFRGIYVIDQIDLTQELKLRVSGRQDWFETTAVGRSVVPVNGASQRPCVPPAATACALVPGVPFTRNDSIASWDVGAVYALFPNVSAFVGYSNVGYPLLNTEEPQTIGQVPETGTQVETGLRAQFGTWIAVSSSIYRTTRKNAFTQITIPNPAGAGNLLVSDNFDYRVDGWDTDINLSPLDGWSVVGNVSFQNPEITSYPAAPANVGNAVPSAPSFIANIWTSYRLDLPGLPLNVSLGARFKNHQYSDVAQTRFIPGSTVFDFAVSLPVNKWTIRTGINNLFDRDYFLHGAGAGAGVAPGQGRTFFVKVSGAF